MDNTNPYAHQKNWVGIAELAQAAGVSTNASLLRKLWADRARSS